MGTPTKLAVGTLVLLRQTKRHPIPDVTTSATVTQVNGDGTALVRAAADEVEFYAGPNTGWEFLT